MTLNIFEYLDAACHLGRTGCHWSAFPCHPPGTGDRWNWWKRWKKATKVQANYPKRQPTECARSQTGASFKKVISEIVSNAFFLAGETSQFKEAPHVPTLLVFCFLVFFVSATHHCHFSSCVAEAEDQAGSGAEQMGPPIGRLKVENDETTWDDVIYMAWGYTICRHYLRYLEIPSQCWLVRKVFCVFLKMQCIFCIL